MRFQTIGFTIGILLLILGIALLIPAAVDYSHDHYNAHIFLYGSIISYFFGGLLYLSFRGSAEHLTTHHAFIMTTLSWATISLFAALPLYFSDINVSFTDAVFETVSGVTTTGSTVLSGLDQMSHGILIWRSIIEWIGGIGIIAFAIILLPLLRIGGMQLFQSESSDKSEKALPRTSVLVGALFKVYCILTLFCAITYHLLGMDAFDAIAHAMTTMSTAGFSTHDASFGYFDNYALDIAGGVFMLLAGLPFILYVKFLYHGNFAFHKDEQVQAFLKLLFLVVAIMTFWLWFRSDYGLADSFRHSFFNITSLLTTTGFASTNYTLWGTFPVIVIFFLTYLGACAGSSTGGIKIMRLLITARAVRKQTHSLIYPHSVFSILYQGKPVSSAIVHAVLTFLCLFVLTNAALTLALTFTGVDFMTALTGAATALANVGPGLGDTIGPAGNFAALPTSTKWLLCLGMLLGRLEIMTVYVLLTPHFWKH